jgi:hypothetical protein
VSRLPDDSFATRFFWSEALTGTADRPPRLPRIVLYVIVVLLLVLAAVVAFSPPSAGAAPGQIRHYETPCQTAARNAYGVPLLNDALVRWQLDHLGTATGAAYNARSLACPQPAKWDWSAMVMVGAE